MLAVLEWLRLDGTGGLKGDDVPVFSNEVGEPLKTFKKAWLVADLEAYGVDPHVPDKVSSFFQVSAVQHFADSADATEKTLRTN